MPNCNKKILVKLINRSTIMRQNEIISLSHSCNIRRQKSTGGSPSDERDIIYSSTTRQPQATKLLPLTRRPRIYVNDGSNFVPDRKAEHTISAIGR